MTLSALKVFSAWCMISTHATMCIFNLVFWAKSLLDCIKPPKMKMDLPAGTHFCPGTVYFHGNYKDDEEEEYNYSSNNDTNQHEVQLAVIGESSSK